MLEEEPHAAFQHRILRGHVRLGSGIVRVIGPPCSGKTTALLGALVPNQRMIRRRTEAADGSSTQFEISSQVYISADACRDTKALGTRLISELGEQVRVLGPRSVGESLARTAKAARAASDSGGHLHVVIDHIDSKLWAGDAAEVGEEAARWFAAAEYPSNVTVWLVACVDFVVPHATRLALLPHWGEASGMGAAVSQHTAAGSGRGAVLSTLMQHIASGKATAASTAVCDARRLSRTAVSMASLLPSATLQAIEATGAVGSRSKDVLSVFADAASGAVAEPTGADGDRPGEGEDQEPLPLRLLTVAAFICGALTPHQTSLVFGDAMAPGRANRPVQRRANHADGVVARSGTPNMITVSRLATIYEGLRVMHRSVGSAEASDVEAPDATTAMHHLATLESRGAVRKAPNNHAAYKCSLALSEAAAVAEALGLDVYKLLPSGA